MVSHLVWRLVRVHLIAWRLKIGNEAQFTAEFPTHNINVRRWYVIILWRCHRTYIISLSTQMATSGTSNTVVSWLLIFCTWEHNYGNPYIPFFLKVGTRGTWLAERYVKIWQPWRTTLNSSFWKPTVPVYHIHILYDSLEDPPIDGDVIWDNAGSLLIVQVRVWMDSP